MRNDSVIKKYIINNLNKWISLIIKHNKNKLFKKLNTKSHEGAIFKNMMKLITGESIARIIGFATAPIITRIYLPEHLGVISVFTSFVMLMIPFGTFRYSLAIPLPKDDNSAFNIFFLSFIILSINTLLLFLILMLFGKKIFDLFSINQITDYWYILPVAFAGMGLYELFSSWAIRKKDFITLAKTKVWEKIAGDFLKVLSGILGIRPLGLLIGQIISEMGGILILFKIFKRYIANNIRYVTKKRIIVFSKRYFDFPKYRIPSQFLLNFSARAPLLYFAWHFGADMTGQLSLAIMMLSLPITLIGYSTGKAYYAEIAKIGKKSPDKIFNLTKNIIIKLFLFSIIPFSIILLFAPFLFSKVFGSEWQEAGYFARILSPYLLTQFIYAPISEGIISVFEKQLLVFIIELLRTFIVFIIFVICFFLDLGSQKSLLLYSIALTIHYAISAFILFYLVKKEKGL